MTYQKPINPQRFDEPLYEQLRLKKKAKQRVRSSNKRNEQRAAQRRSVSRKSGATKARSRAGTVKTSK